MEKLRVY